MKCRTLVFAMLFGLLGGGQVLPSETRIKSAQDNYVKAEFVDFEDDGSLVIKGVDGQQRRIDRKELVRFRGKDGSLQLQLASGAILVLSVSEKDRELLPSDGKWQTIARTASPPKAAARLPRVVRRPQPEVVIPAHVLAGIKKYVTKSHRPSNRMTQHYQYRIRRQKEAYLALQEYNNENVDRAELFRIKDRAKADHPHDYATQLHVVKRQSSGYHRFRKYSNPQATRGELIAIKKQIGKNHPGDYRTQASVIERYFDEYLKKLRKAKQKVRVRRFGV